MDTIELTINYGGAPVAVSVSPEENCVGMLYPIELDGNYAFTLFINEEEDWEVLKEQNGRVPDVDASLKKEILRKLQIKLKYAA